MLFRDRVSSARVSTLNRLSGKPPEGMIPYVQMVPKLMKIETLITRFRGRCVYCGKAVSNEVKQPHPDAPSRDHFIPLSRGGSRGAKNTVLACYECNQTKGNMDPRLILFTWLWLNPRSFHAAVERVDAVNWDGTTIH